MNIKNKSQSSANTPSTPTKKKSFTIVSTILFMVLGILSILVLTGIISSSRDNQRAMLISLALLILFESFASAYYISDGSIKTFFKILFNKK